MIFLQIFKLYKPKPGLGNTRAMIKTIAVTINIKQSMKAKTHVFTLQDELKFNFNLNEKYKNRNKTNKSSLPFL